MINQSEIKKLLADAYHEAAMLDGVQMSAVTEALEMVRSELLQGLPYSVWNRLSLPKSKFDLPGFNNVLRNLKSAHSKSIFTDLYGKLHDAFKESKQNGWNFFLSEYIIALCQWNGEVYDRMCRPEFAFPEEASDLYGKLKKLNSFILESRWVDAYPVYEILANHQLAGKEQKAMLEVTLGLIELYYFPDYKNSLRRFQKAESFSPQSSQVQRGFAEYYFKAGDFNTGRTCIFKAISLDNRDVDNYLLMGDSYRDVQEFSVAEKWYNEAIDINFLISDPYVRKLSICGNAFVFKEKQSEIPELVSLIESIEPENPYNNKLYNVYRDVASYYSSNGDSNTGEEYYRKAIHLHDNWITAYLDLATMLINNAKLEEASKLVEEAKELDPEAWDVFNAMALLASRQNNIEAALMAYNKCIELRPLFEDITLNQIGVMYSSLANLPEADDSIKKEHLNSAKQYYELAIEKNPGIPLYHTNYADAAEQLGEFDLAKNAFLKAINLEPENATYYNDLANFYYDQDKFSEAADYFLKATLQNSQSPIFFRNLGLAYRQLGKWNQSMEAYEKALQISPGNAEALNAIGIANYSLQNYAEARNYYFKAIEAARAADSKVDMDTYWANIGLTYREENNLEEAEKAYQEALTLEPNDADNHNYIGIVYYRGKKYEQAINHYKLAIDLRPTSLFYENLGLAYYDMRNSESAIDAYEKAIELEGSRHSAINYLGNCFFDQGNYSEARIYYNQAIQFSPDNHVYHTNLGLTYYNERDYATALLSFNKALTIQPEYLSALNYGGNCNLILGNLEEAEKQYRNCIALKSEESVYHSNLGIALLRMKRFEEADPSFQTAIDLNPHNTEALQYHGLLWYKKGDFEKAEALYKEAYPNANEDAMTFYTRTESIDITTDPEEERKKLEKKIWENPTDFFSLWSLGTMELVNNKKEESKEYFRRALETIDENNPEVIQNLKKSTDGKSSADIEAALTLLAELFSDETEVSAKLDRIQNALK